MITEKVSLSDQVQSETAVFPLRSRVTGVLVPAALPGNGPTPSSKSLLKPQHWTPPPATAHAELYATAMDVAVPLRLTTLTGVDFPPPASMMPVPSPRLP